ncbi:MFS transporter [Sphingobacterium multivorum]
MDSRDYMKTGLRFISDNSLPLRFGWLLTFFSSFGQTFFISLFVPPLLDSFALSKSAFGGYYALATIVASLLLLNFGYLVDSLPIGRVTSWVLVVLVISLLALAVAPHSIFLVFALIGLRLAGQGFLSHISLSAMSRYFSSNRGKALSLTSLGYPSGEIIFPFLLTSMISLFGWRYSLVATGGLVLLLLVWIRRRDLSFFDEPGHNRQPVSRKWLYFRELLYSKTFWIMILPTVIFAFTVTALFVYQYVMVEEKGWSLPWYYLCFGGYAISRLITMLLGGVWIDRRSARAVFPFILLPGVLGLTALITIKGPLSPFFLLIGLGLSSGLSNVVGSAIIAEIYGTERIGQVRSLFSMFGILSTAVAPAVLGMLLDNGISFEQFAIVCIIIMLPAIAASFLLKNKKYVRQK